MCTNVDSNKDGILSINEIKVLMTSYLNRNELKTFLKLLVRYKESEHNYFNYLELFDSINSTPLSSDGKLKFHDNLWNNITP